jgi:hypothetical protein
LRIARVQEDRVRPGCDERQVDDVGHARRGRSLDERAVVGDALAGPLVQRHHEDAVVRLERVGD